MRRLNDIRRGFTLVEIMIVGAIIAMVVGIALPAYLRQREISKARACQEQLAKIEGAKEQYALENNIPGYATPTWADLVGQTLYLKRQPVCPASGVYALGTLNTDPTCDYQVVEWLDPNDFAHELQ